MESPFNVFGADGLAEAAKSGDRVKTLRALRDHIADRIEDGIAARDLAALTRQLRDITRELEELAADDEGKPDAEDELAQRRAAVLSAAGVDDAAAGGDTRP